MALYIDRNAPGSGLASLMAARGRQGDTELVHMTKPEVQRLMSTGLMSLNPKTGLPEYFLGSIFKGIKSFAKKLFKPKVIAGIALSLLAAPLASSLIPGTLFGASGNLLGTLGSGALRGGVRGAFGGLPWGMKGVKKGAFTGAATGLLASGAVKASQAMRGSPNWGLGPKAHPPTVRELENARMIRDKAYLSDLEPMYEKYGTVEGGFDPVVEDFAQEVIPFGAGEIPHSSEIALKELGITSTPSNIRTIKDINLGLRATGPQIRSLTNLTVEMESPDVLQRLAYEQKLGYVPPEQIVEAQQFTDVRPSLQDVLKPETYPKYFQDRGLSSGIGDVLTAGSTALDIENRIALEEEEDKYDTASFQEPTYERKPFKYVSPELLPPRTLEEIVALYTGEGPKKFFDRGSEGESIFQSVKKGGLISLQDGGAFEGQVQGDGHGMEDNVMMPINGGGIAAVSPKEYVVPADVMAMLGNGNADEGAEAMDGFISKFRKNKYGRDSQPPETDATKALQSLVIS